MIIVPKRKQVVGAENTAQVQTIYDYIDATAGTIGNAIPPVTPAPPPTPNFLSLTEGWSWSEVVTAVPFACNICAVGMKCGVGVKVC
jgi:hypothetical protein